MRDPLELLRPGFGYDPRGESVLATRDPVRPAMFLAGGTVLILVCCWLAVPAVRRRLSRPPGGQAPPVRARSRERRKPRGRNGAGKSGWKL